jgi:hypothetical protein
MVQAEEQPSRARRLPSSQDSVMERMPSPQRWNEQSGWQLAFVVKAFRMPSSHSSPGSMVPLPQVTLRKRQVAGLQL